MNTILVTGGAGFVGGHLLPLLLSEGYSVRVFDSFVTGKRDRIPEGAEVIEGDVRDRAALAKAMEGVEGVVHLAAVVSVPVTMDDPLTAHDVNVTGTANVLEAARAARAKAFTYASSAAVYGNEPSLPKREDGPTDPRSPYALSKLENEQAAKLYSATYGFPSTGLRFFNIYGPGQDASHPYASVVPRWIEKLKAGEQVEAYGDGTQTRDFIHVRDVARAILLSLASAPAEAKVFNIASGTERSLNELFALLASAFPGTTLSYQPPRAGDVHRSVADISLAQEALGFTPSVSFEEGIEELLA